MKQSDQIHETLAYVQEALGRKESESGPTWPWLAIYWGAYFLIAFALIDWNRQIGLRVFNWGAIVGGVLAATLAVITERQRKQKGETAPRNEVIIGKIILGILASFAALVVMGASGRFDFLPYFQILMLLIALELYIFGVFYKFLPLSLCGLLLMVWSVALAWVDSYQLTVGGAIIAGAMLCILIAERRKAPSAA